MSTNHYAKIVGLKNVRTFPEADRLKLATCFGNQVVIGLNHQDGDLGIYIPSDTQLSAEFCKENNLYRDSELNKDKDAKPGMFDANRRVRAQTFRKQKSDGFWVPIALVKFTGVKDKELVEGFEFDTLNGVPICNKYINPATLKAAQQNQQKKTKTAKTSIMFKEHIETKHIGANMDKIEDNDLVIYTEKMHGCVHYDSIINTLEHGDVKIGWLVDNRINAHIKAMDTLTNEIIFTPIDAFYILKNDGKWYEIELDNGVTLKITGNNPVWLPELGVYRRVDELVGDELIVFEG